MENPYHAPSEAPQAMPDTKPRNVPLGNWTSILMTLPLLPVCGFLLNGSPVVVFSLGATSFILSVLLFVLFVARSQPLLGPPPVARRFRFTMRDLLCLTTVLFGMTVFIVSGFKCEAAERASRPGPLPAAVFRQFTWELESGLICLIAGALIWIRAALKTD